MTKEEVIKKAYGELWCFVKNHVDEHGWIHGGFQNEFPQFNYEDFEGYVEIRPKSLAGIETNNGWIKIESEDDLPKETDKYWVIYKDDRYKMGQECFYLEKGWDCFLDVSHYQPIVKPKPPIY